jgi:carboxymethylenebutenolidase
MVVCFKEARMLDVATETFLSQDHPITVEVFRSENIPQPAILLLHGANGLTMHHDWHRRLAAVLAEAGYAVFFVHYFDRTGTGLATRETARECFLLWHQTIVDAVAFVAGHLNVISDRIAFLGLSLGATLSLSVATQLSKIQAVAVFCGEVPDAGWRFITSLPPTFVVHGGADRLIPVAQAYKIEQWLKERNIYYEMKIYPEEGHIFREEALNDSTASAIAFFHRFLQPSPLDLRDTSTSTGENNEPLEAEETVQPGLAPASPGDQQTGDDPIATSPQQ